MKIDQYNDSKTVQKIYAMHELKNLKNRQSRRLGASAVGETCKRKVWYGFRHAKKPEFKGQTLRLFETGHKQEERMIKELTKIGCDVWYYVGQEKPGWNPNKTPEDPSVEQITRFACDGHFIFKADAIIKKLPEAPKTVHLGEFKTANDKSYKDIKSKGIEQSKPGYYIQAQVGAFLLNLSRIFFLVVNKNTDELYGERIKVDKKFAKEILAKAEDIIESEEAPERINNDPSFWLCKFCDYNEICHGVEKPDRTCRTCAHSSVEAKGDWSCAKVDREYGTPCGDHIYNPAMLSGYEVLDAGDDWILYKTAEGEEWKDEPIPF